MTVTGISSEMAFARCPIMLRAENPGGQPGLFEVSHGGAPVYEGRFSAPLAVNLSDIAEAVALPYPDVPEGNRSPVVALESAEAFQSRRMDVAVTAGEGRESRAFSLVPGGVSTQNLRRYMAGGTDAFAARFLDPAANFFLTTRGSSWLLEMEEAELSPLYFLNPGGDKISVATLDGAVRREYDGIDTGAVGALDLAALRRELCLSEGILASVFDVFRAGSHACRLAVTRSAPARESVRVRFRGSLGTPEIIRLVGKISVLPEFDGADEAGFSRLDPLIGSFLSDRGRLPLKAALSVTVTLESAERAGFLLDMLASDEVAVLDLPGGPLKVVPSAEEINFGLRPEAPFSAAVKLSISEAEPSVMAMIADALSSHRQRVFSPQFNDPFN